MKMTEGQRKQAQELMDFLNEKFKGKNPFKLIREGNDYSFAFVLPEYGIGVKMKGPPEKKKD